MALIMGRDTKDINSALLFMWWDPNNALLTSDNDTCKCLPVSK